MASDDNWKTQAFRQSIVSLIEKVFQRSGVQIARSSSEMENHVFIKAKTREEYMIMVAKLVLHVRELSQCNQNPVLPLQQLIEGANSHIQAVQGQQWGPNNQGVQNIASQGSSNQMMNMGPQGQMQQQGVMGQNPGMGGMQGQMGNNDDDDMLLRKLQELAIHAPYDMVKNTLKGMKTLKEEVPPAGPDSKPYSISETV